MHIEVFQNEQKTQWHWHFRNKGRITADAESFPSKANALRAAKAVVKAIQAQLGLADSVLRFEDPVWDAKRGAFVVKFG